MRGIGMQRFGFILKSLNHNFRYRTGNGRNAMLYIAMPRNEFKNERDLVDVCAFPSPRKYPVIPKFDFRDYTGRLSRGYATFFKILVDKKMVSPAKLSAFVPDWRDVPPKDYVIPAFVKPELKSVSKELNFSKKKLLDLEATTADLKPGLPPGFTYSGR